MSTCTDWILCIFFKHKGNQKHFFPSGWKEARRGSDLTTFLKSA